MIFFISLGHQVGSFKCDCNSGYRYDEASHQCIDINECNLLAASASQQSSLSNNKMICRGLARCVNTLGSFKCECPDGYKLDPSGLTCSDMNECLENPSICRSAKSKVENVNHGNYLQSSFCVRTVLPRENQTDEVR